MEQKYQISTRQNQHLKSIPLLGGSGVLALVTILLLFCTLFIPTAFADESLINCDAHKGACSQTIDGLTVSLEITPRPVKAMQDLVFKVFLSGNPPGQSPYSPPQNPYIDLGMPAMKMGPNRVELKENGSGTYEGSGVIVRCKSGRRTWFANVTIPGTGEVKFIFDVIY
jgi:hypothetical protein